MPRYLGRGLKSVLIGSATWSVYELTTHALQFWTQSPLLDELHTIKLPAEKGKSAGQR